MLRWVKPETSGIVVYACLFGGVVDREEARIIKYLGRR